MRHLVGLLLLAGGLIWLYWFTLRWCWKQPPWKGKRRLTERG